MTEIRLYDTLSRRKADLTPLKDDRVSMYVCGPTVYDRAHIGNARPVIVFDVLFRLLRQVYGAERVVYARNITDVEDKIITRAAERGVAIDALTRETTEMFHADMAALHTLEPTVEPKATDHIGEMIEAIEALIANGAAYVSEGHALFAVEKFDDYGALSGRALDEMVAGARVEVADYKRHPGDFVLWKPSADDEPGWDSPWGRGRPGWHIECTAMSAKHLGQDFDIHGGGVDLVFPHHENERAQSLCAHPGSRFAQIWMHNGYVMVEGEKMSKSLGNFITVHDLLEKGVPGLAVRLAMLTTHYRQPFDWTDALAIEAERTLRRWSERVRAAAPAAPIQDDAVIEALADDLNTPKALARLHELYRDAGGETPAAAADAAARLAGSAALLGFDLAAVDLDAAAKSRIDQDAHAMVEALLAMRAAKRKAKEFAAADQIRDGLAAAKVAVQDGAQGSTFQIGREVDQAAIAALYAEFHAP